MLCAPVAILTRAKRPFQVNVFFHGLNNYDSHFLIQKVGEYKKLSVYVIPGNSEKYLSFSLGSLKFKILTSFSSVL